MLRIWEAREPAETRELGEARASVETRELGEARASVKTRELGEAWIHQFVDWVCQDPVNRKQRIDDTAL